MAESPPTRRSRAPHPEPDPNQNLNNESITESDKFSMLDAFDLGLRLGLAFGRRAGIVQGREEEDTEWQAQMGVLRDVLTSPRQAEFDTLRQPSDSPCASRCRACSRCSRYTAAWRNQRRYGQPDYPGGQS